MTQTISVSSCRSVTFNGKAKDEARRLARDILGADAQAICNRRALPRKRRLEVEAKYQADDEREHALYDQKRELSDTVTVLSDLVKASRAFVNRAPDGCGRAALREALEVAERKVAIEDELRSIRQRKYEMEPLVFNQRYQVRVGHSLYASGDSWSEVIAALLRYEERING